MEKESPVSRAYPSLGAWLGERLPVLAALRAKLLKPGLPRDLGFSRAFGFLALLALAIQVLTGIFLTMHYKPDAGLDAAGIPRAFASLAHLMQDVPGGWFIRYAHAAGASLLLLMAYLHLFRGVFSRAYRKPRELVWGLGFCLLLGLLIEAFLGCVLPWGQASGWSARVVTNLVSTIPGLGSDLAGLIRGAFEPGDAMLGRFFALHVTALPLVLLGLAGLHLLALRPTGAEERGKAGSAPIPFHPYYTVKLGFASVLFLIAFAGLVFFAPESFLLGAGNLRPFDLLKTPSTMEPAWYLAPFYSMLRAATPGFLPVLWGLSALFLWRIFRARSRLFGLFLVALLYLAFFGTSGLGLTPSLYSGDHVPSILSRGLETRFWGLVVMAGSVWAFLILPWLDSGVVLTGSLRRADQGLRVLFGANFILLGLLGSMPSGQTLFGAISVNALAQVCTAFHLGFFVLMPRCFRPKLAAVGKEDRL